MGVLLFLYLARRHKQCVLKMHHAGPSIFHTQYLRYDDQIGENLVPLPLMFDLQSVVIVLLLIAHLITFVLIFLIDFLLAYQSVENRFENDHHLILLLFLPQWC